MAVSVTPIKGHVHWDSQAQQWQVKASRQEKEGNKIRTFVKILEVFATLAEAIAFLVAYFGATNTGATTARLGDFGALGLAFQGVNGTWTESIPSTPAPGAIYEGTLLIGDEYVGTRTYDVGDPGSSWGITPSH